MDRLRNYHTELLHYVMTFAGGFMGLYAICAHGSYGSAQTGNLMHMLIDFSSGDTFSAMARVGAMVLFVCGVASSWLLKEFCDLPLQELCLVVDAAALVFSARMPDAFFPFFRVYPLFFATSFQWGIFSGVGKYASAPLFVTGNLKNCIVRWLKYSFYRKSEDLTGARIYTLTVTVYLLGGWLGCWAVDRLGAMGAYYGFIPLAAAAAMIALERFAVWQEESQTVELAVEEPVSAADCGMPE